MRIDTGSYLPIYDQIIKQIQSAIASGVYRPGEMLPSQRALALKLKVNPNTVRRAYEELEREGVVVARQGLGMFVRKGATKRARRREVDALRQQFVHAIRSVASDFETERIEEVFRDALDATRKKTIDKSDDGNPVIR